MIPNFSWCAVAGRPSVGSSSMSEVRSERALLTTSARGDRQWVPWSNQLAPISRRRGANAGTGGGAQVAPDVSVSKPKSRLDLFPPTAGWLAGSITMDGDAPIGGCLAARSQRVFGLGLCETAVFQVARVSVSSVRVFISYLEDR